MAEDPYVDAIKAFARLAIAAGAEPSRVQATLGPDAKCDTTWARKQSINQLAAAAGTAAEAIGLTFELHHPEGGIGTQKFLADLELREQFATTAIKCGAALRRMRTATPAHRRNQQLQANRAILDEFGGVTAEHDNLGGSIAKQVTQVRCYARAHERDPRDWTSRAELFKACRRLVSTLDEHDVAARRLYRLACDFRWRVLPRTTPNVRRPAIVMAVRAKRDNALGVSAAIRAWVIRTSPGPL